MRENPIEQLIATAKLDPKDPGVLRMLDSAQVPAAAFDGRGLQIYENAARASLLGHELGEFEQRHVVEIIAHEPEWTLRVFARLRTAGRWRGLVSMSHKTAEPVVVEGKVILTTQEDRAPLYFGLLRTIGPATNALQTKGVGAYGLTTHEAIVLQLMAEGLSDRDIAKLLGVTVWTIHKQSAAVLRKMDATSRTLASIRAVREGLV